MEAAMRTEGDPRMGSITARNLFGLLQELRMRGIRASTIKELHHALAEAGVYPARDFGHLCDSRPPDGFFTCQSSQELQNVVLNAGRAMRFAAVEVLPRLEGVSVDDLYAAFLDSVRLWFDFVFIDQTARNLRQELAALPELLEGVDAHFVIGERPLERVWCCYEIALSNRHLAHDIRSTPVNPASTLRSFVNPTLVVYHGWDLAEVTEPDDKAFIEERIRETFPDGLEGFHRVMHEANAQAVLSTTEAGASYPPAALESLVKAGERWWSRRSGE